MHHDLEAYIAAHGFVTRTQILDCGADDRTITLLVKHGELVRIGPGLFAPHGYVDLGPEAQHLLRIRARWSKLGDTVVFTHQSAALLHRLPVWGIDLSLLQVTRLDGGRGRRQAGVQHHVAGIRDEDIVEIDGLLVATPARTVWDLAVAQPTEQALVTADAALHEELTDDDELLEQAARNASWRRARHAKTTLNLTDPRSESPGETRSRYWFRVHGLPRPETQYEVFDEDGLLLARTDFAWPEIRHLAEFDGMLKYRATTGDPDAASRAVGNEKRREDRLRGLGWGMTRIVWRELSGTARDLMITRLRHDLDRSRRIHARVA